MTLGSIRGSVQQLTEFMTLASANYHSDVYVRVSDDMVLTLAQTNQRQVVTYGTFHDGYFDSVSGDAEAIIPVGGKSNESKGYFDYLTFAESDGTIELQFEEPSGRHDDHPNMATRWKAVGSLETELRLVESEDDLSSVPFSHPVRWTPDDQYVSQECLTEEGELPEDADEWKTPPTVIETTADIVRERIVEPSNFVDGVNYYPITVDDGEFVVDVSGNQVDDRIAGPINAESVEGPDVDREFQQGVEEVFSSLSGPVRLETAPSDAPLSIVSENRSDRTVRNLIAPWVEV